SRTVTQVAATNGPATTATTTDEVADVNGDGLPDLVSVQTSGSSHCIMVGFGDGTKFMAWNSPTGPYDGGPTDCRNGSGQNEFLASRLMYEYQLNAGAFPETDGTLIDINGDGVLDRIDATGINGDTTYQFYVAFGLGDGTFSSSAVRWGD